MAAPIPAFVRLTDDAAATGKYVETQSETISGVTQQAHRTTQRPEVMPVGIYDVVSDVLSIVAAAQDGISSASGFLWLQNPTAATKHARLRRLEMKFWPTATTVFNSSTRVVAQRFAYTGTASGTAIVVSKKRSTASSGSTPLIAADATNGANVRINMTGMTITLGGLIYPAVVPNTVSGVGVVPIIPQLWEPRHERDYVVLAPGEGVVIYQIDAAVAADTRKAVVALTWDEVDAS